MPKKTPGPDFREEVASLMSELDLLAVELGMTKQAAARRRPAGAVPSKKATPGPLRSGGALPAVAPWWDGEPDDVIEVPAISLPPLPRATESEPEIEMRPWSPAAASAPLPLASPGRPAAPAADTAAQATVEDRPSRTMTVVAVIGVLVAGVVYLLTTRIDLVSTSGPSTAQQAVALTLSGLRATTAQSSVGADSAPTQQHFPASTTVVVVDAVVEGTSSGDTLEYRVELTSSGVPSKLISDKVQPATAAANHHVEYAVTGTSFAPGDYTVTVFHGDRELGRTTFTIDVAPSSPAATAKPSP
jgi:hypothetical protein